MMRLAYGQIKTVDRETMMNARQMGIDRVQFNLPYDLPADKYWKYEDLANFKGRCDQYGVIVEAMENLPISFYDKAMLGLPGRDEQIDNVCESIRNLGRVGIPVLGTTSRLLLSGARITPRRWGAMAQRCRHLIWRFSSRALTTWLILASGAM